MARLPFVRFLCVCLHVRMGRRALEGQEKEQVIRMGQGVQGAHAEAVMPDEGRARGGKSVGKAAVVRDGARDEVRAAAQAPRHGFWRLLLVNAAVAVVMGGLAGGAGWMLGKWLDDNRPMLDQPTVQGKADYSALRNLGPVAPGSSVQAATYIVADGDLSTQGSGAALGNWRSEDVVDEEGGQAGRLLQLFSVTPVAKAASASDADGADASADEVVSDAPARPDRRPVSRRAALDAELNKVADAHALDARLADGVRPDEGVDEQGTAASDSLDRLDSGSGRGAGVRAALVSGDAVDGAHYGLIEVESSATHGVAAMFSITGSRISCPQDGCKVDFSFDGGAYEPYSGVIDERDVKRPAGAGTRMVLQESPEFVSRAATAGEIRARINTQDREAVEVHFHSQEPMPAMY